MTALGEAIRNYRGGGAAFCPSQISRIGRAENQLTSRDVVKSLADAI
jgi:hypothetical protein